MHGSIDVGNRRTTSEALDLNHDDTVLTCATAARARDQFVWSS
jgi:hypothetical protein